MSTTPDRAAELPIGVQFGRHLEDVLTARVRQTWRTYQVLADEVRRVRREEGNDSEDVADARASRELARGEWLEAKRTRDLVDQMTAELCSF